jgi:hypothetical protein
MYFLQFRQEEAACHPRCAQSTCGFPVATLRRGADAVTAEAEHPWNMRRRSYAIWWKQGDEPRHAGKFELFPLHVLLSGKNDGTLSVPLGDIVSVDYHRGEVTIQFSQDPAIHIGSLDAPGALLELTDALRRAA